MPRDGAIIFSDLTGRLDVLRVACDKCGRAGRYRLSCLIDQRGLDGRLPDWLTRLLAIARSALASIGMIGSAS
jgi:hypothetical protein